MGKKSITVLVIYIVIVFTGAAFANEGSFQCNMHGKGLGWGHNSEGGCNNRWDGCYGSRQPVKSIKEARKKIEDYYVGHKDIVIGEITERRWGYEGLILDSDKKVIDRVLIHRQTGRIRSIY